MEVSRKAFSIIEILAFFFLVFVENAFEIEYLYIAGFTIIMIIGFFIKIKY